MSEELGHVLRRLLVERKTETLKSEWSAMPAWVFCSEAGTPLDGSRVRKVMARVLKAASLPPHFTPHCLRHTFASQLLQDGESAQYVQEQLGHASITITTQTYGKWLPKKPVRGGVNSLDDPRGSKTVANAAAGVPGVV